MFKNTEAINKSPNKDISKVANGSSRVGPPRGYDKLSSVESDGLAALTTIAHNLRHLSIKERDEFTFKGKNDLEGLCIKIPKLSDLRRQDTLEWTEKIEEGFLLNETTEEKRRIIIRALISDELKENLPTDKDSRALLDTIVAWQYNRQKFLSIQSELHKNTLRDTETPSQYFERTLKLMFRADICVPKEEKLLEREKTTYILQGLPKWMRLEQVKQPAVTLKEMMTILDKICEVNENQIGDVHKRPTKGKLPKGKYCTYHKSGTHNTEDCRTKASLSTIDKKSTKTTRQEREDAHTIWETTETLRKPLITIETEGHELQALLDTGAHSTMIRAETANQIKAKRELLTNPKTIVVADGREMVLTEKTVIRFTISQIPNAIYKVNATIVETSNYDMIFGTDFLSASGAIFNFKDSYIEIDGYTILQVGYDDNPPPFPEQVMLTNGTPINAVSEVGTIQNTLTDIINIAKARNPKLGLLKSSKHTITLTDLSPLLCKPYAIPLNLTTELSDFINELITQGVMKPSTSKYLSPAFVSRKKNGKIRLLVDYRKLNDRTVREEYPFPGIDQLLQGLEGNKIFSTIDLSQGYYQMELEQPSRQYTAVILPFGCYEFNRMPFGLVNAPKAFQRAVSTALANIPNLKIYIDDILVFSKTPEEHIQHLKLVLDKLYNEGFSINFEKAIFAVPEAKFLGRLINQQGIKAYLEKELTIDALKWPTTKTQLQKLLGNINWYRQFIPKISMELTPIYQKLSSSTKTSKIIWTEEDKQCVDRVFKAVNKNITINHARMNEVFTLYTDASDKGISAILVQAHGIVGLYSNKLNNSEGNYTTMEKELLAIIKGLSYYRNLIIGNHIIIKTDNKNLIFLNQNVSQRAQRWKGALLEFDIEWQHIEGKHNTAADFISRLPEVCKHKENREMETIYATKQTNAEERVEQVKQIHTHLSHPGVSKLYNTIKACSSIPVTKRICEQIVKSCFTCQLWKSHPIKTESGCDLHTTEPGAHLSLDLVGPLRLKHEIEPDSSTLHVLVVVDRHSRYCKLSVLRNINPATVIKALTKGWFQEIGLPKSILSDQGRQFTSTIYKEFLREKNIKQHLTSPYNPQSNGITERLNQEINKAIRMQQHLPLKMILRNTEKSLNHLIHTRLKTTPEIALRGQDSLWNIQYDKQEMQRLTERINERMTKYKDKFAINKKDLKIGDHVWIKNITSGKLEKRWIGPFKILGINPEATVVTVDLKYKDWSINTRRVRKVEGGVDVVSSDGSTENF